MPYIKHEYDYLVKMLLIGASGVGKTSLVTTFTEEIFKEDYSTTIAVDFKFKSIVIDGATVRLQIWDTAGAERFRTLTSHFYRGAQGAIIAYDCTNKASFDSVNYWRNEILRYCNNDKIQFLLVGNKCDLIDEKVITREIAMDYANSVNMPFIETSAKQFCNVNDAFISMAARIKHLIQPAVNVLTETYPSIILDGTTQNAGTTDNGYLSCCGIY